VGYFRDCAWTVCIPRGPHTIIGADAVPAVLRPWCSRAWRTRRTGPRRHRDHGRAAVVDNDDRSSSKDDLWILPTPRAPNRRTRCAPWGVFATTWQSW